jgi:hypothetical protein
LAIRATSERTRRSSSGGAPSQDGPPPLIFSCFLFRPAVGLRNKGVQRRFFWDLIISWALAVNLLPRYSELIFIANKFGTCHHFLT